jgi:rhamnose transport system permease protein
MSEFRRRLATWDSIIILLTVLVLVVASFSVTNFGTSRNFTFLILDLLPIMLVALPMTFIIVTGEIDLSVASILGLSGALLGWFWNHNWPIEAIIPVVLVIGGVAGLFNGFLVTRVGLPSLAVTIGTLTLYRGLAFVVLGDTAVANLPLNYTDWAFGTFAGTQLPNPFIVYVVLAIVFGFVLHRTTFGRSLFAIGANEEAAFFSGLRVKRIKLGLFVLSGAISALAGIIFALRFGSARADNGTGLELSVVAVVLLGGVSIFGGKGHMLGVVVAVLLLAAIRSALTINDVADEVLTIVTGSLLLLSVLGPSVAARVREMRPRGEVAAPQPAGSGAGAPH